MFDVGYVANSIGQPRAGIPFVFSISEIYLGETRRIGVTMDLLPENWTKATRDQFPDFLDDPAALIAPVWNSILAG